MASSTESTVHESWQVEAYQDFAKHLQNEGFPCLFGKSALKRKTLKLLFVDAGQNERQLASGIRGFTEFTRQVPAKERLYSPLIVIFDQGGLHSLSEQHQFCWRQLQALHERDPQDWPTDVPEDPNNSRWTFCFDGVQLFFNMSCPAHMALKSRNLGDRITLIVNPRENFDLIANRHSAKGVRVRQTIRERVETYNGAPVPKELGFFGSPGNLEWRQYQLDEAGSLSPQKCPLKINILSSELEPL